MQKLSIDTAFERMYRRFGTRHIDPRPCHDGDLERPKEAITCTALR